MVSMFNQPLTQFTLRQLEMNAGWSAPAPRRCHFQYRDPPAAAELDQLASDLQAWRETTATSNCWDYSIFAELTIWLFNFFYALTNIALCLFEKV
jgi:hypothetical protein